MANDLKVPTQPKSSQDVDLKALVEAQAKELAELRAVLMATIQAQPKVTPESLWAQQHQKEVKIKEELDRLAALFQESVQKRTQWEANRINLDGKKLFKVHVGWCPELIIRANDEVTAKAYYDQVCGIRSVSTNHAKPAWTTYEITDVTNDPVAQQTAKSVWEYQAPAA